MNLAQIVDPRTGLVRANARGSANVKLIPPPAQDFSHHHTHSQKRILNTLTYSRRPMSVIQLSNALGMPRDTVYDCVMKIDTVECTGLRGREKYYWVRK